MVAARNARLEITEPFRNLERGIPPSDVQHPKGATDGGSKIYGKKFRIRQFMPNG